MKKFKVVNTDNIYKLYVRRYYLEGWGTLEWVAYVIFICLPLLPLLFEILDNNLPFSFVWDDSFREQEEVAERIHQIKQAHRPNYL